jgi:dsDNA-specific endonuclease/ATPase MutS2
MGKYGIFMLIFMAAGMISAASDAQERLMKEEAEKLKEINRQVVQALGNIEKYDNQTIYIKAKIVPLGDDKFKVIIEKVSEQSLEAGNVAKDEKIIIIKGKVSQDKARKFTIDLENVLPPPDDSPKDKKSQK